MSAEPIDVATAREMWRLGDTVIDVRTPEEYANGHVAGAINVPFDDLIRRHDTLPPGHVITFCGLGGRARRAAERLSNLGRDALCVQGGTKAWAAAGLPVVTGPQPGARPGTQPGGRR